MKITVKLFATFVKYLPENSDEYPMKDGATVAELMDELGIPREEFQLCFINAARAELDTVIEDGDRVGLFPAVGGG